MIHAGALQRWYGTLAVLGNLLLYKGAGQNYTNRLWMKRGRTPRPESRADRK